VGCIIDNWEKNPASIFSLKVTLTLKIEIEFCCQSSQNSPFLQNKFIQEQTQRQCRSSTHTAQPLKLAFITNIKIPLNVVATT
jgi:hypothetical protein